ncbi:hypothetical protein NCS56_01417400 [Fusarium sp. Ph1]|nr:hypothetical protein NCS56_01417400 [Fusarium sp. Ph1]
MTDLLRAVPRDVFLLILEALPKADLKTLSQASSWLRDSTASTLWKSITIKPLGESHLHHLPTNGLPYRRLRTATQLHLRDSFTGVTDDRCPHIYDRPRSMRSDDTDDNDEIYHEPQREFYFDDFADKVKSLLDRMEPDQLQSFRHAPGDTLPPKASLQTLSLITDPNCLFYRVAPFKYKPGVNLSSFRQFLNFTWKGLRAQHMTPLCAVLRNNSAHLKRLELDFANLLEILSENDSNDYDDSDASNSSDDQDDGMSSTDSDTSEGEDDNIRRMKKPSFFASTILGVDPNSPTLLFPRIRVLSLSLVPLAAKLDLEFIGLACIPGRMKYILLPFTSKTSLKAVHIRQTMSDISNFGSWAFVEVLAPLISRANSDASFDSDLTTYTEDSDPGLDWDLDFTQREPELRNEFRHFAAEWALGPDGIPSLDIIAFGDFAYGGLTKGCNVLLGRSTGGTSNFRMLHAKAGEWKDALDKYHVAMGACPVEHLFTF